MGQFPDRVPVQPENKSNLLVGSKETSPCYTDPQLFPGPWVYFPMPTVLSQFPTNLPLQKMGHGLEKSATFSLRLKDIPVTSQGQTDDDVKQPFIFGQEQGVWEVEVLGTERALQGTFDCKCSVNKPKQSYPRFRNLVFTHTRTHARIIHPYLHAFIRILYIYPHDVKYTYTFVCLCMYVFGNCASKETFSEPSVLDLQPHC